MTGAMKAMQAMKEMTNVGTVQRTDRNLTPRTWSRLAALGAVVALVALAWPVDLLAQPGGRGGRGGPPAEPAGPFTRMTDGRPDMTGYWEGGFFVGIQNVETPRTIVSPADNMLPYRPEYRAESDAIRAGNMYLEPELHCYSSGVPHQVYLQFGFQIVSNPGIVAMAWEFMDSYGIIPVDEREHIPANMKLWMGDPVGRWEGDTLVVETTNQNGRTWLDTGGHITTDQLHVVERFTMTDIDTIEYEATLTDPVAFTEPVVMVETFRRNTTPGFEQMEFACISGNQDRENYPASQGGPAPDVAPEDRAGAGFEEQ